MTSQPHSPKGRIKNWVRFSIAAMGLAALTACDPTLTTGGGGSLNKGDVVKVALLVPYGSTSAGDETLARSLENAARLALVDLGTDRIEMTVYNTAGQTGNAAAAANQAAADGAKIIVGPLRSDAANAAAVAVRDDKLNVLAFSNNASIAGGNMFILGNTFDNIAQRLLSYAGSQGRNRMVVVHPQTTVGQIAQSSVARAAARTNVSIVGTGSFEFSQEGIVGAIPGIAATVKNSGANAIMLTSDSAGALPLLAQLLPEQGVSPSVVKYLGLTRWDIPNQTLTLPGVQGGWFALPDPTLSARFSSRYQSTYGSAPHPLAGLAYDGMAAVGALVAKNRDMSRANLTQSAGFVGVNGVFRLRSDGTNQRSLAVAQAISGTVRIIDPAPKSFGRGGS
jgi:ABC-type branched-subunit amino acid transport system substrate-binding protein